MANNKRLSEKNDIYGFDASALADEDFSSSIELEVAMANDILDDVKRKFFSEEAKDALFEQIPHYGSVLASCPLAMSLPNDRQYSVRNFELNLGLFLTIMIISDHGGEGVVKRSAVLALV